MEINQKLARLCNARGWDQVELNRRAGNPVSKGTLSNYFAGKSKPSLEAALMFARALNVPLEYLADDTQDDLPPPSNEGGVKLSEREEELLRITKHLGYERALGRLLGMPVSGDFGPLP